MRAIFLLLVLLIVLSAASAERITGEVRAVDGRQVAGLQLYRYDSKTERWRSLDTDRKGHFRLNTAVVEESDRVHYGRVVAWAERYGLTGAFLQRTGNVIILQPATRLTGRMVDIHGQPIAEMRVTLTGFGGWYPEYFGVPKELTDRFSAGTDADGRWAITGASSRGAVFLQASKDGYLPTRLQMNLDMPGVTDLPAIALPTGSFRGRVVDERGKPVKGVYVVAEEQHHSPPKSSKTLADGSYVISNLPAGNYYVMVYDPSMKRVAMARTGQVLAAGQEQSLPDLVLIPGAFVEGTVTEEGTGKPVAGLIVGCRDGQHPFFEPYETPVDYNPFPDVFRTSRPAPWDAKTDKKGHFRLIVAPGEGFLSLPVAPRRYLVESYDNSRVFNVTTGETQVVNFTLNPGCTLRGVAVDGRGKPVAGAWLVVRTKSYDLPAGILIYSGQIDLSRNVYAGEPVRTNAKGEFAITGLPERECEVLTTGYDALAAWRPVTPAKITLPAAQPLKLVLEKIPRQSFSGRVISTDGTPLEGARVHCVISYPDGRFEFSETGQNSRTDRQGRYTMTEIQKDAEVTISGVVLPGYRLLSGNGKIERKDGQLIAEDIVLEPVPAAVTNAISGRVVGTDGKPASDVKLLALQDENRQWAQTDADGRFSFSGLAMRDVTVFAASGLQWGQAVARADGGTITIQLKESSPQPAPDAQRAYAMLREIQLKKPNFFLSDYMPGVLVAADPELALKLLNEDTGQNDRDRMLMLVIATLAKADPVKAAAWAPGKLAEIRDPATRAETTLTVAAAIINCDAQGAAALYSQGKQFAPTGDTAPAYYARLVALAWRLKNGEDAQWLTKTFETFEFSSQNRGMLPAIAGIFARTSPPLLEQSSDKFLIWEGETFRAILRNLPEKETALARRYMTPLPRDSRFPMYPRLFRDDADPDIVAITVAIRKFGKADPAWALEMARAVTHFTSIGPVLAEAARGQDPATAADLYREAFANTCIEGMVRQATEIIQAAATLDPALGRDMLTMLLPFMLNNNSNPNRDENLTFMRAYHACDPAVSRLLIESEYYREMRSGKEHRHLLCELALAMAAVDYDRALAMVAEAPDSDSLFSAKGVASFRLAQYLLAPPSLRETMPLDYIHMDDRPGWLPGDQQVW